MVFSERNDQIVVFCDQGATYRKVGAHFGISGGRVAQIYWRACRKRTNLAPGIVNQLSRYQLAVTKITVRPKKLLLAPSTREAKDAAARMGLGEEWLVTGYGSSIFAARFDKIIVIVPSETPPAERGWIEGHSATLTEIGAPAPVMVEKVELAFPMALLQNNIQSKSNGARG